MGEGFWVSAVLFSSTKSHFTFTSLYLCYSTVKSSYKDQFGVKTKAGLIKCMTFKKTLAVLLNRAMKVN